MYLKSQFPSDFIVPDGNAHLTLFAQPNTAGWQDYILYVDAQTGQQRTYEEFRRRVGYGATALTKNLGLQDENEDLVGIITYNSLEHPVLIHSLIYNATPFVLIPDNLPPPALSRALKRLSLTRLFVGSELLAAVLPVAKELGISPDHIYSIGGRVEGHTDFGEMIEDVQSQDLLPEPPRPVSKDALAYLLFSSGSTGEPKQIMVSHYNIKLWAVMNRRSVALQSSARDSLPICLIYKPIRQLSGLNGSCFHGLVWPRTCIILRDQSLDAVLRAVARYKVTNIGLHPKVIRDIIHYPRPKDVDLSSLKFVATSGSYVSPELMAAFVTAVPHQFTLCEIYGMTEASGEVFRPSHMFGSPGYVPGSFGVLPAGFEARIVREDGSEADFDEAGELYLRGGRITLGYWKNEKATEETYVDGWLRTGDLFRVNRNGQFFFIGRSKDIVRISGQLVSPIKIENVLLTEPRNLVRDIIIAGVWVGHGRRDDEDEDLRAWIVLSDEGKKQGADATIKALEHWNKEKCGEHEQLRGGIEVVDEIPRTLSGKPARTLLRQASAGVDSNYKCTR